MLDAAEKAGIVHMVAHEFRWMPDRALFGRAIADGLIGTPRFLVMNQFIPFCADRETRLPKWLFDAASGGGWLGAGGSHLLDQIRAWLGDFALLNGLTAREIEEVLYLSVPYAGFPAANTAKVAMIEALSEIEADKA